MSTVQRHSDGRPAAFRRFELTISVYLSVGAPLPETFREWLERATGVDLSDGPATPTSLERVVEPRHPPADDVIAKRTEGHGKY